MTLYLASAHEAPHSPHPYAPGSAACGRSLRDMRPVTEVQALVWLGNRRCKRCADETTRITRGNR